MKKFRHFEIVKIIKDEFTELEEIAGLYGFIQTDGSPYEGEYIWGVYINKKEEIYMLKDSQLITTGVMYSEKDFYDGTTLEVVVNKVSGEGSISGNDNEN